MYLEIVKSEAAVAAPACTACPHKSPSDCATCIAAAVRQRIDARNAALDQRQAAIAAGLAPRSKTCRSCRETKPLDAFGRHRLAHDGRRKDCKSCAKRAAEEKARAVAKNHRLQDLRARVRHRVSVAAWDQRNPDARRARAIVARAVKKGSIVPPDACQAAGCDRTGRLEAHHADYAQPRAVLFVCPSCHRRGHAAGRIRVKFGVPRHLGRIPT